MDSIVLKYLIWTLLAYGLQSMFAFFQVIIAAYLVFFGLLQLTKKENLGKWSTRLGFFIVSNISQKKFFGVLEIICGIFMIVPFFTGASYFLSIISGITGIGIYLFSSRYQEQRKKTSGKFVRIIVSLLALVMISMTIWEQGDLITKAKTVISKAAYWRKLEVVGWQQKHNPNAPKIGDMAPDFFLHDTTGKKSIRLSDYRGKQAVVLIFGSFT